MLCRGFAPQVAQRMVHVGLLFVRLKNERES